MAAYQEFLGEKNKIDKLIAEGFVVEHILENLDGALVRFKCLDSTENDEEKVTTLHLSTADARKYLSTLLFANRGKS